MIQIDSKIISEIGSKEKYIRAEHYNTLKVWWARRPIRAVRAILINEIISKTKGSEFNTNSEIVFDVNPKTKVLKEFSEKYDTKEIKVLDVFAGGGSIPFESARLGCKTYSAELNPIASLLQETNFNYFKFNNYPKTLKEEGDIIINSISDKLRFLYSLDSITPYVIFWGKTIECEDCNSEISLGRIKYLCKRKTKSIIIDRDKLTYQDHSDDHKEKRSFDFICNHCKKEYSFLDIKKYCKSKKLGNIPLAVCYHINGKKQYKAITNEIITDIKNKSKWIDDELEKLKRFIPSESVIVKNGVINPTMYDLKSPADFFNKRQLLVLVTLINEISLKYRDYKIKYGVDYAKQLVLGMTSLLEFLVDWNSNGTMWIAQNEQSGRSLAGPGVGMKWDYIEINPFYKTGSNLHSKLERVSKTFSSINLNNQIEIIKGTSTSLPISDKTIDVILTDPPYYDSIDYTALSDFFRPWFEKLISNTYDENIDLKTDIANEAIVQLSKTKIDRRGSHHYQKLMTQIFRESKRVLSDSGKLIFMYSHKTIEGWEVIANSIKDSGLYVTSSYPLDMERAARPRGMSHQALNGVIIFELIKDKSKIQPVSTDISNYLNLENDFDKSHLPIYIASLACKEFSLTNNDFSSCYKEIKGRFDVFENDQIDNNRLDKLVSIYLNSLINGTVDNLNEDELSLLNNNNLILGNKVKSIEEIAGEELIYKAEILKELVSLFNDHKKNSSTKISLEDIVRDNAKTFFQYLSGSGLNTIRMRSFESEKKISRMIITKLNEV